jgi:hypothetical protein
MGKALSMMGVVLLAFLASALIFAGFLVSFRTYDSVDALDTSVPDHGLLMTTLEIGITVAACRFAAKLGASAAKGRRGLHWGFPLILRNFRVSRPANFGLV